MRAGLVGISDRFLVSIFWMLTIGGWLLIARRSLCPFNQSSIYSRMVRGQMRACLAGRGLMRAVETVRV